MRVPWHLHTVRMYDSLVVLGSYVTDQDVANFPMPVLTLGAQLDGGLGRPGMLTKSLTSAMSVSKTYDDVVKTNRCDLAWSRSFEFLSRIQSTVMYGPQILMTRLQVV